MRIACMLALLALPASGAERVFNPGEYPLNAAPPGFHSTIAGIGNPGDWKVVTDEPAEKPGGDGSAPAPQSPRTVLAQLARDPSANHFPLLIFEREIFGDFKLTTRIRFTGGATEQLAGVVFRYQNESNYFVAAANALRGNICVYRAAEGEIKPLLGQKTEVTSGDWHRLTVQSEGNRVIFAFDDKEPLKLLVQGQASGQIGFWTKSDSTACFGETRISYTPRLILAQVLVNDALKESPKVMDLQIFAASEKAKGLTAVAAKDLETIGQAGGKTEQDTVTEDQAYYARGKGFATVTIPLHDRNGEPVAVARVMLKTFSGQTEDSVVLRARTVVKPIQARVHSLEELLQ